MKNLSLMLILFAGTIFALQSCKVEKRVHRPGYHVEWKKSAPKSKANTELVKKKVEIQPAERIERSDFSFEEQNELLAGKDEALVIEVTKQIKALWSKTNESPVNERVYKENQNNKDQSLTQELCETIVMTDGKEVLGHVTEITPDLIRYKKCNYMEGPTISVRSQDVSEIRYPNGSVDVISGYQSADRSRKNDGETKLEVLGLLSMIFAIIGLFVAGIPLGLTSIILAAISFGKFARSPGRFKGQGFAIAGMIIGAVAILGALIFIANMT